LFNGPTSNGEGRERGGKGGEGGEELEEGQETGEWKGRVSDTRKRGGTGTGRKKGEEGERGRRGGGTRRRKKSKNTPPSIPAYTNNFHLYVKLRIKY